MSTAEASRTIPAGVDKRRLLARLLRQQAGRLRSRHAMPHALHELWLVNKLDPESTTFHLGLAVRIVTAVDVEALRAAGQHLVDRHATLRTLYGSEGDSAYLEVRGAMEVAFEQVDASDWDEDELWQQVRQRHVAPFDLENGPILRVTLLTRAPEDHVFLFVVSHIACDGLSMGILLSEFIEFYGAECLGIAINKLLTAFKYVQYLRRQEAVLGGAEGARHLEYWMNRLGGEPPELNLPTDRPRLGHRGVHNAIHRFSVEEPLYRRLDALARAEGVTMFAVLMAAYQTLLMRLSGQTDILVGVPVSGRMREEYEGMVGHMVNGVVVRSNLSGDPTFRAHLARAWQDILATTRHQEYPSEQLLNHLGPSWHSGRAPMFQVSLNLIKTQPGNPITDLVRPRDPNEPIFWGPPRIEPYPYELIEDDFNPLMKYELGLRLLDPGGSLVADWQYDSALFDAETIRRFARSLIALLEDAAERPDTPLHRLDILGTEGRRLMLEGHDARARPLAEATLPGLFEAQVVRDPEALTGLARGYLGRPGLTAERFVADPYALEPGARRYRTGDLARWRPDDTLEFLGRADAQVKLRGFRIEPGEIESTMARHPEVARAAVAARDGGPVGKYLVGYIVPVPGTEPTAASLRAHLSALLPEYMVPAAFVRLAALPLTVNGKLDRKALPAPDARETPSGETFVAPRTPTEEAMAAIWAEVLQRPRVGIHDNFFDLGGHSLMAIRIFSLVQERFEKDLPLASLFARPTIAQFADLVEQSPARDRAGSQSDQKPTQWARLARDIGKVFQALGKNISAIPDSAADHRGAATGPHQ